MSERIFSVLAMGRHVPVSLDLLTARAPQLIPGRPFRFEAIRDQTAPGEIKIAMNDVPMSIIAAPIPVPEELWRPALPDAFDWPGAERGMTAQRAQILVTSLRDATTPMGALEDSFAIMLVTAMLARDPDAVGVYWGSSGRLTSALPFMEAGQRMGMDPTGAAMPVDYWVRIRFTKDDDERIGAVTNGLTPFIGREFELMPADASLMTVAERVHALSFQVVRHGLVIKDGETAEIGGTVLSAAWLRRGTAEQGLDVIALTERR